MLADCFSIVLVFSCCIALYMVLVCLVLVIKFLTIYKNMCLLLV